MMRFLTIPRLTLSIIALGLLWRAVRYALGFPIWGDEAFVAVNFITRDYAGLIRPLEYGQIVPLVFMWAELAISRGLGLSEWALRLLPTLAGIAALLLIWAFARRILPRRPALLALGIFAASAYIVRHGAEVKPYITDLLIALAMNVLAWGVFQNPRCVGRWVALVLFVGAAVWCSYPAVFVGIAVGFLLTWLLIRERFRAGVLVGWLAFGAVLGASSLAMYIFYAKPHALAAARLMEIEMWRPTFPPLGEPLRFLYWIYAIHTGLMFAYPHGGTAPGSFATFLLVILGAVRLARTKAPLVLLLLGPLVPTFVAAALKAYPYGGSARTSLYMAPAFCLLAGLGLCTALIWVGRHVRRRHGILPRHRLALTVAAGVLGLIPLIGPIYDFARPYQTEGAYNSRAAVIDLVRQTAPGDRWITFNAVQPVDYAPYLGDWRGVGGQFVFDVLRFHPVPVTWAPPPDTVEAGPAGRVWLLCYHGPKVPFPDDKWAAYLEMVTRRLGSPRHQQYFIKSKKEGIEALDVYRFGS